MNKTTKVGALRILMLEDNSLDAELIEHALQDAGIGFTATRVSTKKDFEGALRDFSPDVLLLDYTLPDFDGISALQLAKAISKDVPAIMVTSSVNEETAADCIKAGAADYVLKNSLSRLGSSIRAAIESREAQEAMELAQDELASNQQLLLLAAEEWQRTFNSLSDAVSIHGRDHTILRANKALSEMTGIPMNELLGRKCYQVFHGEDTPPSRCPVPAALKNRRPSTDEFFEPHLQRWISVMVSPIIDPLGDVQSVVHVVRDITAGKASEQALAESERRFRSIVEHSSECICNIGLDGRFLYMSPNGLHSHGLSMYEIREMHATQLAEPGYHDLINETLSKARETGQAVRFEFESDTVDGVRWFQSTLSPVKDDFGNLTSFIRVSRDIQAEKESTGALAASETRFRSVFEKAGAGMALINPEGRFIKVNQSFCKFLGYHETDLLQLSSFDVARPNDHPFIRRTLDKVAADKLPTSNAEQRFLKKDGTIAWGRVTEIWIRESHSTEPYAIKLVQDISERKAGEKALAESLASVRRTFASTIQAMAMTVEARDPYTAGHQQRVARLAQAMAAEMGLSKDDQEAIHMAALVHDLGKLYVPSEILSMPRQLSDIEFQIVKNHVEITYDILRPIEFHHPIALMAYQHHERCDGSGYPLGLSGEEILLGARIIGVADVVEAMASHRPYRPALGLDRALSEITRHRGTRYDAEAVDACVKVVTAKGFELG